MKLVLRTSGSWVPASSDEGLW